jgi:hypothetical protein
MEERTGRKSDWQAEPTSRCRAKRARVGERTAITYAREATEVSAVCGTENRQRS